MPAETIKEYLVRLGVDPESEALAKFDRGLESVRNGMTKIVQAGAAVASAFTAVGSAAVASAVDASNFAQEILTTADQTGIAVDRLQALSQVAERFGVEQQDVNDALGVLSDRAEDALRGTTSFQEAFEVMGVRTKELKGLGPEQIFMRVADAAQRMKKEGNFRDFLTAGERLLGGDLRRQLLPLLSKGSDRLEQMIQQRKDLGTIISRRQLEQARSFGHSLDRLKNIGQAVSRLFGSELAPVLETLIERFMWWFQANKEIINQRIDKLARDVGQGFKSVAAAIQEADEYAQSVGGWVPLLRMIFNLTIGLGAAWAALGVYNVIAGLVGITTGLAGVLATVVTESWALSAVAGVLAGNVSLASAAKIVWASATTAVGSAMTFLTGTLLPLIANLALVAAAVGAVIVIFHDLYALFTGGETWIGGWAESIWGWLKPALTAIGDFITDIGATIIGFFAGVGRDIAAWGRDLLAQFRALLGEDLYAVFMTYVGALVAPFELLFGMLTALWLALTGDFDQAWAALKGSLVGYMKSIAAFFLSIWDVITSQISDTIEWIQNVGGDLAEMLGFEVAQSVKASTARGQPRAATRPAAAGTRAHQVHTGDTNIKVETQPGQDEEEVARRVEQKRRQAQKKQHAKAAEKLGRGSEQ